MATIAGVPYETAKAAFRAFTGPGYSTKWKDCDHALRQFGYKLKKRSAPTTTTTSEISLERNALLLVELPPPEGAHWVVWDATAQSVIDPENAKPRTRYLITACYEIKSK